MAEQRGIPHSHIKMHTRFFSFNKRPYSSFLSFLLSFLSTPHFGTIILFQSHKDKHATPRITFSLLPITQFSNTANHAYPFVPRLEPAVHCRHKVPVHS